MASLKEEISRRRTFAIISHPDAGKTTLTEKFLLYGGAIAQAGEVKGKRARAATSDWMEIEKQRGISVTSSVMQFQHDEIWSLQELADRVNVNMNLIKQVVSSLLFSRYQVRVVVSHSHTVAEAGGRRERSQPHGSRHLQFGVQSEGRPNSLKGGRCERRG